MYSRASEADGQDIQADLNSRRRDRGDRFRRLLAQVDLDTLRQAAEQGDAEAQYRLAYRYATGVAVSQDNAEASRWLRLAAEQGHTQAQQFLERR